MKGKEEENHDKLWEKRRQKTAKITKYEKICKKSAEKFANSKSFL